jgi:hypothetical protein
MAMDSWSLNKEVERLDKKLKEHYDIIGALAIKLYKLEDKLAEISEPPKPKTKAKAKVKKSVKSK